MHTYPKTDVQLSIHLLTAILVSVYPSEGIHQNNHIYTD